MRTPGVLKYAGNASVSVAEPLDSVGTFGFLKSFETVRLLDLEELIPLKSLANVDD